jgi:hypothetical protein
MHILFRKGFTGAAVLGFTLSFMVAVTGIVGCDSSVFNLCKAGQTDCGDFCCSQPKSACCASHQRCCDPAYPHHCAGSGKCYKYFTGAMSDCGYSYELCGGPIASVFLTVEEPLPGETLWVPDSGCSDN